MEGTYSRKMQRLGNENDVVRNKKREEIKAHKNQISAAS